MTNEDIANAARVYLDVGMAAFQLGQWSAEHPGTPVVIRAGVIEIGAYRAGCVGIFPTAAEWLAASRNATA